MDTMNLTAIQRAKIRRELRLREIPFAPPTDPEDLAADLALARQIEQRARDRNAALLAAEKAAEKVNAAAALANSKRQAQRAAVGLGLAILWIIEGPHHGWWILSYIGAAVVGLVTGCQIIAYLIERALRKTD